MTQQKMYCAECEAEITDSYYTYSDNNVQLFLGEMETNVFCSVECAVACLMLEERTISTHGVPQ